MSYEMFLLCLLILIPILLVLIPVSVFLSVKLGTYGYLIARRKFDIHSKKEDY